MLGSSLDEQMRIAPSESDALSQAGAPPAGDNETMNRTMIWGTNIVVDHVYQQFRDFIENCRDDESSELVFPSLLEQVRSYRMLRKTAPASAHAVCSRMRTPPRRARAVHAHAPFFSLPPSLPCVTLISVNVAHPRQIRDTESWFLNLDCARLRNFAPAASLYPLLLGYPQEIIPIMDMVVGDVFGERFPAVDLSQHSVQVRPQRRLRV